MNTIELTDQELFYARESVRKSFENMHINKFNMSGEDFQVAIAVQNELKVLLDKLSK